MSHANKTSVDGSGTLVALLHAYSHRAESLKSVGASIREIWPCVVIYAPELPASVFSMKNPNRIVADVLSEIDRRVASAARDGRPFERIILVGHSLGALLARKLYVVACGESSKSIFESIYTAGKAKPLGPRTWAPMVERIILLAGMNRGWRLSHHINLRRAVLWTIGSALCHLIRLITGRSPLIFTIRRGAEFITELRIQWIRMRQAAGSPQDPENPNTPPFPGKALAIQLLGSIDDMVAPEDNVDLVSGKKFVYLDVPYSGHSNVIDFDDKEHGAGRKKVFVTALMKKRHELKPIAVVPSDERFLEPDDKVTKMVFVIHGIRDEGYWTHKIARRIKHRAPNPITDWATETSSYGYFPMLPFLFSWYRRQKVEWLMDQYTEALARYPNASISYVGHSNGTYILAKALELYPCCQFENVVFAGSVVSRYFEWKDLLSGDKPRVKAILNFVGTRDWVVAFFPKLFQGQNRKDLGSLGHDGFALKHLGQNMYQAKHVEGGHGAAIKEPMWDMIADFVLTGNTDTEQFPCKGKVDSAAERIVQSVGEHPIIVWLFAGLVALAGLTIIMYMLAIVIGDPQIRAFLSGMALTLYFLILWLILTRV